MRRVLSILAVAALVTLAACGDDEKESASTTTAGPVTTAGQTVTSFTGEGSKEFCDHLRAVFTRVQQTGSAATPEERNKVLRDAAPDVRQAGSLAPAEIKADVAVLVAAYEKLLTTLDQSEPDFNALLAASPSQNLILYARTVCQIPV